MKVHSPAPKTFINYDLLSAFDANSFRSVTPFPWHNFHAFLTSEGFETLYRDFPSLDLFEQHSGITRSHGQRPHNRYYLAYESSIYRSKQQRQGIILHEELPKSWQQFIQELETSQTYREFIQTALGVSRYKIRYAWHVGFSGCEVSPHIDSSDKIGTHILYFNTHQDWQPNWGGEILVLSDKKTEVLNPDYSDFATTASAEILDNRSFLFKNSPFAWHGVRPLSCPDGYYRRLFNIIIEYPQARTLINSPIGQLAKKLVPFQPLRSLARELILR
jgi:Rps23 Pro-64 3,4-dihydroxylase Tpa1-like proline 4-hydroxylase